MTLPFPGRAALRFVALLLAALALPGMAQAQANGLLKVTEAFQLTSSVPEAGSIHLHWDIADNYYLYRGRISAKPAGDGFTLGELQLPEGEHHQDPYFGEVQIYHGGFDATLPYTLKPGHQGPIKVAVQFQGCHEVAPKICYPPHTETLVLEVPVATPAAEPAAAPPPPATPGAALNLSSALGQFGGGLPGSSANAPPLPPEQAFQFDVIADGGDAVLARFTMPSGYYLYRERSHIELASGEGVRLGDAEWPDGVQYEDPQFGTTEVYFNEVDIRIPLQRSSAAAQAITLKTVFQGCQEGGICYPPMTRTVDVKLPAISPTALAGAGAAPADNTDTASTSADAAAAGNATTMPRSEQQQLADSLEGSGRWLALLLFFLGGLLLAFTPCILPMIPILSGLIAGAGDNISTGRAFVLSVVYVVANAIVFTIAGVVAGLVGANLQAAFQTPWVLWLFAALFVALALSMFGFYELELPKRLQERLTRASNKQKAGSITGVAIMGLLSAFIVGPCVAPPLAGAVLYIAQQQDPVFGGLALFVLGLGMGVPLVIFGTAAGKLLPRAGAWMDAVKAVFGVLFLAIAIWMLSRILGPVWIMLMTAALLIACAVYMGALERVAEGAAGWRKLWKALGLMLLIFGAAELIGVTAGSRDPLQPLDGVVSGTAQQQQELEFRNIDSVAQLESALAAAQQAGQPVMVDFYADWCVSCKEMERFTYSQPEVHQALAGFQLLKVDVTENNAADKALLAYYGIYGPPATIFYASDGTEMRGLRLVGFEEAAEFVQRVQRVGGDA